MHALDQINPTESTQGTVGEANEHKLTVARTLAVVRENGRVMRECICRDNFGNEYLVYHATLTDGEVYEVSNWVRPSIIVRYGGWSDALIDDFRKAADNAFKEAEARIPRVVTT